MERTSSGLSPHVFPEGDSGRSQQRAASEAAQQVAQIAAGAEFHEEVAQHVAPHTEETCNTESAATTDAKGYQR